jgi:hypothetical protein
MSDHRKSVTWAVLVTIVALRCAAAQQCDERWFHDPAGGLGGEIAFTDDAVISSGFLSPHGSAFINAPVWGLDPSWQSSADRVATENSGQYLVTRSFDSGTGTFILRQFPDLHNCGSFGFPSEFPHLSPTSIAVGSQSRMFVGNKNAQTVEAFFGDGDLISTLTGPATADFGWDVEVADDPFSNDVIVAVSEPLGDYFANNGGSVSFYRFNRSTGAWTYINGWAYGVADAWVGYCIDIAFNPALGALTAVAGAPFDDQGGADAGAVYFYQQNPVTGVFDEGAIFVGNNPGKNLGWSVALNQTRAIAGAPALSDQTLTGTARIYDWNGSSYAKGKRLRAFDDDAGNWFGFAVALREATGCSGPYNVAAVGALYDDAGSGFYMYDLDAAWSTTNLGNGLPGLLPSILSGSAPTCLDPTLTLNLAFGAPASLAFLITGINRIDAPFQGGTMVPSINSILATGTSGSGSLTLQGPLPPEVLAIPLYFQIWMLDPFGPNGFSASNALVMTPP